VNIFNCILQIFYIASHENYIAETENSICERFRIHRHQIHNHIYCLAFPTS